MKNIYLPKTEEVRYLEQNLTETETEQKISDSYNFEFGSYSDISSSKIYGPMYRASAERSVNERFTPLKIPCPEERCPNTTAFNQTHTCGGSIEVSNYARIKCSVCGVSGNVRDWKLSCSSHHSINYYSSANGNNINAFKRALFKALSEGVMNEDITMELIRNLRD